MPNRNNLLVALVVIISLPLLALVAISTVRELPAFFDSRMSWGMQAAKLTISSDGPCRVVTGTSETMLQAAFRIILIQGGIVTGFGIGVVGMTSSKGWMIKIASTIFFLESFPFVFDGFFVLTLPPAVFLAVTQGLHLERSEPHVRG